MTAIVLSMRKFSSGPQIRYPIAVSFIQISLWDCSKAFDHMNPNVLLQKLSVIFC